MMTPEWLAEAKAKYMALLEGPKWKLLWERWGTICTTCDHEDCADGRLFYAEVERLAAENARLRNALIRNRQGLENILEFRKLESEKWGARDGYGGRYGALTREEVEGAIKDIDTAMQPEAGAKP